MNTTVVGYRFWAADTKKEKLYSFTYDLEWGIEAQKARCRMVAHHFPDPILIPAPSCSCGLHAFSTLENAQKNKAEFGMEMELFPNWKRIYPKWEDSKRFGSSIVVCGVVLAWGRSILQEIGFRTEFQKILALGYSPENESSVKRIARKLNCESVSENSLGTYAREFGVEISEWTDK
jgi:hypothetical protein